MKEGQKARALEKVHLLTLDQATTSSISAINDVLGRDDDPLMDEFIQAGIDWIPRDILSSIVKKARSLSAKPGCVTLQSQETLVVASSSNPRKPHIVNMFPNGKAVCSDCPGFTASPICTHAVAAALTMKTAKEFIRWLSRSKRNSGGINYSKAITFGMPDGRGHKGGKRPRKKNKKQASMVTSVVPRVADSMPIPPESDYVTGQYPLVSASTRSMQSIQQPSFNSRQGLSNEWEETAISQQMLLQQQIPTPRYTLSSSLLGNLHGYSPNGASMPQPALIHPLGRCQTLFRQSSPIVLQQQVHLPSQSISRQCTSQPTTLFGQSLIRPPTPQPMIPNALNFRTPICNQTSQRRPQIQPKVSFPTPNEGEFHIYLLQFCPSQTAMCFGCGNPIRKKDVAVVIPNDLVIVSKMLREWSCQGTAQGKIANVYFHCKEQCVQKKQASFNGGMCSIPPQIQPHLHELHKAHLRASLRM